MLLSQAAAPILAELPSVPPGSTTPYNGHQNTGAVRAALQQALDNHKPGTTSFKLPSAGADLSRSDTRSFGESHAAELSNITAYTPPTPHANIQVAGGPTQQPAPQPAIPHAPAPTFPTPQQPAHAHGPVAQAPAQQSPPINPSALNQAPAPLPEPAVSPVIATSSPESTAPATAPIITPTVAETGLPLSAGASGPGPAKGSLHDLKHASTQSGALQNPHESVKEEKKPVTGAGIAPSPVPAPAPAPAPAPQHPTAEEEKRRLAAAYSQAHPAAAPAPVPSTSQTHESAEEEKKRLEREERERILRGSSTQQGQGRKEGEPDEDLPPYQEPTLH